MKLKRQHILIAAIIPSMLMLTSCENMQVADEFLRHVNVRVPGMHGNPVNIVRTAIRIAAVYQANQRQRELAEERAKDRLRSSRTQTVMREQNARRVGVRVPPSAGKPGGIAVTDSAGNPTGKVFVPEPGTSYQSGKVYDLGGSKTYMADSW